MYNALDYFSSGPSIMSISSGDAWYHRRKGMHPAFAPKLVKRTKAVALDKTETWVSERLLIDTPFNAGTEMIIFTISVLCKAAFEYDISHEESKEILMAMRDTMEEFSIKTMINPFRRLEAWMLPERQHAFSQAKN